MRKVKVLAAALVAAFSAVTPALAEDAAGMAKTAAWFPVQALGVGTAMVVGMPICVVRRSAVRIHDFTSEMADQIGGHDHLPPVLFASIIGVPRGAIVGTGEGVYYGGRNAVMHGVEHPFGLDSFSMGGNVEE